MDIKTRLFALSEADSVGNIKTASDLAFQMLSEYCECEKTDTLSVIGYLKGESDYILMLDAHIDQIAMVVTDIDDNGFLTVSNAGGIDIRMLPSRRVTVHGKEKITAVFCSTPPHLSKGDEEFERAGNAIKLCGGANPKIISADITSNDADYEKRRIIITEKVEKTPKIYPRNFAQISKKPL